MSRFRSIVFRALVLAAPLVGTAAAPSVAQADEIIVYPPNDFIAVNEPEYYEGRPVYFYKERWYYRDHGRWRYYRVEPAVLRGRREHWRERERERERARYHYRR